LKFSHLVQINDPLNPLIDPLSREQVWQGLIMKAENPILFVYALDDFTILSRDEGRLRRELRFGAARIRDTITLMPPDTVRQDIEPGAGIPGATLVTTIESPDSLQLFVRFEYETRPLDGEPPHDDTVTELVRQAYIAADTDVVRTIRRLAAEGRL
jgi:hypothetical protein